MLRKVFLAIAATLVVVAVILAVSGGFRTTVGGFRISARSPLAATIAALIVGAAWIAMARRDRMIVTDLEAAWRALERHATRVIGTIALIAAVIASVFATRSAAGADASGYLSQAQMWSSSPFMHFDPLVTVDESLSGWLTTPLGWRPIDDPIGDVAVVAGWQVPTYAPGLPLLMAVPHAISGIDGAHAIVIACAAAAVWATAMIAGGTAGVIAALLLGFSPVFLYQSFQPMSDVPVTAAWLLCFLLLRRSGVAAGFACAIAVLIRPNLAPLAIIPLFAAERKQRFAAPVAVAGLVLALMQFCWYGSALRSGYGDAEELFALSNVIPNTGRYFNWLIATAPVLFLAPFGFIRLKNNTQARALMAFAVLVACAYLVYAVFEHWSYLRFLLPAMAVLAIFAGIELAAWIQRWPIAARFPIFVAVVLGLTASNLFVARALDTFKLADQLRRVEQAAAFIERSAAHDAVLIAGEQSGSMRYHTGRSILRWEAATAEQLSGALATLAQRPLYVVLDAWENEPFLAKFKDVPAVALDWPPVLEAGTSHRTKVWQLSDRARFLNGGQVATTRLP